MLAVPLSFGGWLLGRLQEWSRHYVAPTGTVSLLLVWWLGMALLTALLETWALFGPLRGAAFAVVAAAAVGLPLLDRSGANVVLRSIRQQLTLWRPAMWLAAAGIGIVLLAQATLSPTNGDTGMYHAPFIRWYEELGAVRGLANLQVQLGYNSSWFVAEVLSSWGQWLGSPLQSLNTLALGLFSAYALAPLGQRQAGVVPGKVLFRLLLGVVVLFWYSNGVLSLSPDLAAAVAAFTVMSQALELGTPGRHRPLTLGHLAVVVVVGYAITIKFSVVPLVLIPLVWLWRYKASRRAKTHLLMRLVSISLALMLPWLLNTVVLTGYLLFPFPGLDVLNVDWKFPRNLLYEHVTYIQNFGRNYLIDRYNVYGRPMSFWLPIWWQQQQFYDKIITLAAPGLAVLGMGILWLNRIRWAMRIADWTLVGGTTLAGIIFWFVSAPAYRFGYPFILPMLCLLLIPLLLALSQSSGLNLRPLLALVMVASALITALLTDLRSFGTPRRLTTIEFTNMLTQVLDYPGRLKVINSYLLDSAGIYNLRTDLPVADKAALGWILIRDGQLQRQGLMATGRHLIRPVPYPVNTFDTLRVKQVYFLRPAARTRIGEYGYWYAPFPATSNTEIQLRTEELRDGFRHPAADILSK